VLGDLGAHDDVADLVAHGLAIADAVVLADRRATGAACRWPVLDQSVGVGDHLTVLARVAGLPALTATGLLGRPRLARLGRVTRRRQRAVARTAARLTLKLLHPRGEASVRRDQLIDPRRLRRDQCSDRLRIAAVDQTDLVAPHKRKIPCKRRDPSTHPTTP
jgi:hypothetical protein